MFIENLKQFIERTDFDVLWAWLQNFNPAEVITMPAVFIPLAILIGILAHPQTSYLGTRVLLWVPPLVWIFVTVVVLKNDLISNVGPFILALVSFFIIIGYIVYSQLLAND
jgi:hypothetical protein